MMYALVLFALAGATGQARAEGHVDRHGLGSAGDAQIVVTINPEARVSAIIGAPMPPPPKCGEPIELKVGIVNQGFVTAPLRAAIIGDIKGRVALHLEATKLNGAAEDTRLLHLIPLSSSATDVTVGFSIDNNIGDLGGRDRVYLLLRCVS